VAEIVAKKIAVDFTNLVVNDCYEMAGGSVVTQYDPSWGGVLDLDPLSTTDIDITENQGGKLISNNDKISEILEIFECSANQRNELTKLLAEQDAIAARAQTNDEYTAAQKSDILAGVNEVKTMINGLLSCCVPSSGAKISSSNCTPPHLTQEKIKEANEILSTLPKKEFKPLIILVNGHYHPLIPGPSVGGIGYWNYFNTGVPHQNSAKILFNSSPETQFKYVNGSSLYGVDTDYSERFRSGQLTVDANYINDWKKINGNQPVYIIGHSEGCAMAAGIGDQLVKEYKKSVKEIVLLSCDEGREAGAKVNPSIPTYQLEYMYYDKDLITGKCEPEFDWVIGTDHSWRRYNGIPGVTKFGIIATDLSFTTVHGSSANFEVVFPRLRDFKKVGFQFNAAPNGRITYYTQIPIGLTTEFYKLGDKFILPFINRNCVYKTF
jgi:hypothetical protein